MAIHGLPSRRTSIGPHGLTVEYDKKGKPERFTGGADPRGEGKAIGW
jgi:hypothetical protein